MHWKAISSPAVSTCTDQVLQHIMAGAASAQHREERWRVRPKDAVLRGHKLLLGVRRCRPSLIRAQLWVSKQFACCRCLSPHLQFLQHLLMLAGQENESTGVPWHCTQPRHMMSREISPLTPILLHAQAGTSQTGLLT